MKIADVESSLYKYLVEHFEIPYDVKIFESIFYVDFTTFDQWVVIDSLNHTTGPLPKANYFLHLSIKNGLLNEKNVLNKLCDLVTKFINVGTRIDVYDAEDLTATTLVGELEICESSLSPVLQHQGGGSYRSLSFSIQYAGEIQEY